MKMRVSQVLPWKVGGPACPPAARNQALDEGRRALDILMLAPTAFFSDYGCHVRILEEAVTLESRGHQTQIFTYRGGRDWPKLNIVRIPAVPWDRRYAMGSSWHKLLFDALLLAKTIAVRGRRPPDVIHSFLHEGALVGRILSRLWNVPLVFDYQGSLTGEMVDHGFLRPGGRMYRSLQHLERHVDGLPDAIVTSSAHAARLLRETFDCRCPVIHTIPDCVDAERFSRPDPGQSRLLRRKFGLPPDRRIVAYLGKLARYQGTDLLLEAAAILCAHRRDVHFLVMGYPEVDRYYAAAEALGIAARVTFTGRVPYELAPRYLALADVAVAPKMSETESNGKLLNYMALGLPTVAFDTPVAHEYLGAWGRYASPDRESLAWALVEALDDGEAQERGRQLRRRAVEGYSWQQAGDDIERVYRTVLAKAPRQSCYEPAERLNDRA